MSNVWHSFLCKEEFDIINSVPLARAPFFNRGSNPPQNQLEWEDERFDQTMGGKRNWG